MWIHCLLLWKASHSRAAPLSYSFERKKTKERTVGGGQSAPKQYHSTVDSEFHTCIPCLHVRTAEHAALLSEYCTCSNTALRVPSSFWRSTLYAPVYIHRFSRFLQNANRQPPTGSTCTQYLHCVYNTQYGWRSAFCKNLENRLHPIRRHPIRRHPFRRLEFGRLISYVVTPTSCNNATMNNKYTGLCCGSKTASSTSYQYSRVCSTVSGIEAMSRRILESWVQSLVVCIYFNYWQWVARLNFLLSKIEITIEKKKNSHSVYSR